MEKKQQDIQNISHGRTRNYLEKRHIIQSRMRERRYKYTVWEGPLRQAQGPGPFGRVSELAELADISCARVKDTARVIKAKNGTPHTRS